ncbi:hypothetical protein [Nakamurella leprariae]|uniref:Uncharacterized protein n=1 Tax=Nakamurella leprariae TaxID=2803911 RepID=A0A939C1G5_9ACTN|nr:hypothetical protein [Nakamurella leprariae]MBM9467127.1 hypothetical protein [Nakamurella leprariae]
MAQLVEEPPAPQRRSAGPRFVDRPESGVDQDNSVGVDDDEAADRQVGAAPGGEQLGCRSAPASGAKEPGAARKVPSDKARTRIRRW